MTTLKRSFLIGLCFLVFFPAALFAEAWPKVMAVLSAWEGPRQILLRTDLEDPLTSAEVQDILERLLEKGFVVIPGAPEDRTTDGLILDLRTSDGASVFALSRAMDGAILAFERKGAEKAAALKSPSPKPGVKAPEPTPAPLPDSPPLSVPVHLLVPTGPLELQDKPKRIAFLGVSKEGIDLALLSDQALTSGSLNGKGYYSRTVRATPVPSGRALHLDSGDLDDDGTQELAAVWAEDQQSIYEGTESKIHGYLFKAEGLDPLGTDVEGYLRIVDDRLFLQKKGAYVPFSGPVRALSLKQDGQLAGDRALPWANRNLFAATPLSAEEALAWNDRSNLTRVSLDTGETLPGGVLLEDLGEFSGPDVAVRLENPEYRSGFSKEDRINEVYHSLPRRMEKEPGGYVYTILRERSEGRPFLGKPAGSDALVRVATEGGLRLHRPFAGVDAFILDFALVNAARSPRGAVLLLNEKADGSGQAYLLFQKDDRP